MEGAAAMYFAPYVNRTIPDETGLLMKYAQFLITLESVYGDQHNLDELNSKLHLLQQHPGTVVDYITRFHTLSGRVGWNNAALLTQFKDGLSNEIETILATQ